MDLFLLQAEVWIFFVDPKGLREELVTLPVKVILNACLFRQVGGSVGKWLKKNATNYWRSKSDFFNYIIWPAKFTTHTQLIPKANFKDMSFPVNIFMLGYRTIKQSRGWEDKSMGKVLVIASMGTQLLSPDPIWKLRNAQRLELVIPAYRQNFWEGRDRGWPARTIY